MGKVISLYRNTIFEDTDTESELILKVITNELKRIKFLMSTSKIVSSQNSFNYFINSKIKFKDLYSFFMKSNDIDTTINNLDFKQTEFLVSAFQLQADEINNRNIAIPLQMQETYLKLVTVYTEKTANTNSYRANNYYMYLSK